MPSGRDDQTVRIVTDAGQADFSVAVAQSAPMTAAEYAAVNPVLGVGVLGYATDTGTLKIGDGVTAWNALPSIALATSPQRASSTAAQTGITAATDITGLSVTFTVGTIPWEVEVWVPYLTAVTNSALGVLFITDAANTSMAQTAFDLTAAGKVCTARTVEYISTPGTYTRKARVSRSSGSGTITCLGGLAVLTAFIDAHPVQ